MVFLLFLGSWVAYEFILRSEARAEKLRKAGVGNMQLTTLPVPPPSLGTDHSSLLALFQAVEAQSAPVRPAADETVPAGGDCTKK